MAALRSLAPWTQQADSSSSSSAKNSLPSDSNPTGATSGSTSGGLGAGGNGGASGASGSGGDGSRKRRSAGSVSLIACSACRQARQKCDGHKPDPCGRCRSRRLPCIYEPHSKTQKNDLIRDLELSHEQNTDLQNQNREMEDRAIDLETQNRDLKAASDWQTIILETIGKNGHDREIIKRLRAGESNQSIADWLCGENPEFGKLSLESVSRRSPIDVVKFFEEQCQGDDGLQRLGSPSESDIPWTRVSLNPKLIGHLFDLYFTWVHPVHMLFSELDFKQDFRDNGRVYCSSPLVNAICAMGCHLLMSEGSDGRPITDIRRDMNAARLREAFMHEARATMPPNTYSDLPSLQTFAVMYLVELSSGKARNAMAYLRSAVDGIKLSSKYQQSEEVTELTFWGVQTLNTACMGMTYQKLYSPPAPREIVFEHVRMDKDDGLWRFYRQPGDQEEMPTRPSHAILTAYHQARLFRLIHENFKLYCGIRGKVTAREVLEIYRDYLDWRDSLPKLINNVTEDAQPLPHVLYMHIQYHTALAQHLNPLLHCGFFMEKDMDELKRMVVYHARSGLELLSHSQRLYTARYSLPLLSFCTIYLSDAHFRYSPAYPPGTDVVKFCLTALQEARFGFPLCGALQQIFSQTAVDCGVQLPTDMDELIDSFSHYGMDEILDACTRISYSQPLDQVLRHIDPAISTKWTEEWQRLVVLKGQRPSSSGSKMQIYSLLNGDG